MSLPIHEQLPDMLCALHDHGVAVVVAPPGTGKSTQIPPAIAATKRKTLVVQPRRVAARALARRVAEEQNTALGEGVGYQVRFDRCAGTRTRIEYVTDGILLRRMLREPELADVGAVILDEFHERSINMDLLLALLTEVRCTLREDLWLVVMSATLNAEPLAHYLGDAPIIRSDAPLFPLTVDFSSPRDDDHPLATRCAKGIRQVLQSPEGQGGVLAFLPGVREIEATLSLLKDLALPVLPLHGRLRADEQDKALDPSTGPRIVLATNLAETSLTVPGISAVVDSGLVKRPRFHPKQGLNSLELSAISRASADQRAGRAARQQAGRCLRLWSTGLHQQRPEFDPPELLRSDLVGPVLTLRAWGSNPHNFHWFEAPRSGDLMAADKRLCALGALQEGESDYRVTSLGRSLESLPLDAALGRLVLAGADEGIAPYLASAAVLMQDGRMSLPAAPQQWLEKVEGIPLLKKQRQALLRHLPIDQRKSRGRVSAARVAPALALAFPERLARRVDATKRRYELANGTLVKAQKTLGKPPAMVIALQLQGDARGGLQIRQWLPVEPDWFERTEKIEVRFDHGKKAVVTERVTRIAGLPVDRRPGTGAGPGAVEACLLKEALKRPETALRWDSETTEFCDRLNWLKARGEALDFPDLNAPKPLLEAMIPGCRQLSDLKNQALLPHVIARLSYGQKQQLDRQAPTHLELPSGRRIPLRYEPDEPPIARAKIQHFFELTDTPMLAGEPVRIHLLAPNGRVAQITDDLGAFWRGSYRAVRKDLRGRYPKHDWPEVPPPLQGN